MPASTKFSREFFARKGRAGGKARWQGVDPRARSLTARLSAEKRLRQWCDEAGFDYDKLPVVDGRKVLPPSIRAKYLHWRYGGVILPNGNWSPKKRVKKQREPKHRAFHRLATFKRKKK